MIGIQKKRLADWCNHNTDLLIISCGVLVLAYIEILDRYLNLVPNSDYGFWILLSGVIISSIGMSALVCYRVLLRWHGFF
ncbi:MAG TPA: hypothetical protein VJR22_02245 [Candidatus Nitrosotalea sp.]|nr:hypothetical protein [Nitrososphaerota archaeon]HKU32653.1 hypothetical protein [Candidatus Nitrosotalea sp.]